MPHPTAGGHAALQGQVVLLHHTHNLSFYSWSWPKKQVPQHSILGVCFLESIVVVAFQLNAGVGMVDWKEGQHLGVDKLGDRKSVV